MVVIVIANCEYEAWFLASIESIAGKDINGRLGLPEGTTYPDDVEARADVKGWLTGKLPGSRSYKETTDQALMTRLLKPELAAPRSRSFRRLQHALEEAIAAIDLGKVVVTPTAIDSGPEG